MIALDGEAHKPPARRAANVPDGATDDDPATIDDRDRFAHRLDGVHLVGREDERPALVTKLEEGLAEEGDVDRIEAGERLVHQQDLGVVEDRRDELDLLLIALGQLLRPAIAELRDAQAGQPVERLTARSIRWQAVQRGEVGELVDHRHPRVKAALLGQVTPRRAGQLAAVGPVPGHGPVVCVEDAEDDPHRRRLAGAIRTDKTEYLARGNLEGKAVERPGRAEPLVELIDDEAHPPKGSGQRSLARMA